MSTTIQHTFHTGSTVPMTLRKDGRYTARQLKAIQDDIAAALKDARESVSDFTTAYPDGTDSTHVIERWDDAMDAVTALESEYDRVSKNPPILQEGSTAWLAFHGID